VRLSALQLKGSMFSRNVSIKKEMFVLCPPEAPAWTGFSLHFDQARQIFRDAQMAVSPCIDIPVHTPKHSCK